MLSHISDDRFHMLFHEHEAAIREYCSRRLGVNEANDAAAEVFVVAWRKIDSIPAGLEARLWLFGVARNVVRNTERGRRRRHRLTAKLHATPHSHRPPKQPDHVTVRRVEDQLVLEALDRLRFDDRELLRLRTWEELSRSELAAVLGVSVEAVDMRVKRALQRMAKALKAVGYINEFEQRPRAVDEGGA